MLCGDADVERADCWPSGASSLMGDLGALRDGLTGHLRTLCSPAPFLVTPPWASTSLLEKKRHQSDDAHRANEAYGLLRTGPRHLIASGGMV